jgi:hypothetical protein
VAEKQDFEAKLKAVVAKRTKAEEELAKLQEKLRGIDRSDAKYAQALAPVNEKKAEIGKISQEHVELARMVATLKGGTNHSPLL